MSIYERAMEIGDDGSVSFPGFDMSNGTKPMLIVARHSYRGERPDVIVIRHPGGSCWSGVGMPHRRVPVHFLVFELLKRESPGRWRVREVIDVYPREHNAALQLSRYEDLLK